MYRAGNPKQLEFPDFYLPFSGQLDPHNRWIVLAKLIPWELAEEIYTETLCDDFGAPARLSRMALGALLIKERLGLTDRETVTAIQENPYLQFFIGYEEFSQEPPFDASLMVDFRKRFGQQGIERINQAVVLAAIEQEKEHEADESSADDDNHDDAPPPEENSATDEAANDSPSANQGRLIVDATCAPADIRYPTDVSLLNEAREKTDELIDELHKPLVGKAARPRTYREVARRKFVKFARRRNPRTKTIKRAKRKQLSYLGRNLRHIDELLANPRALPLTGLSRRLYRNLLIVRELYRQQLAMYETNTRRIDDRIVSISQPHVRPIKRGKARADTEFGAKLSVSVIGGYSFVDRLSWDNYNESVDLVGQIETHRQRLGCYPESVHADQIYRTRANRAYCKERGIRLSGPPLGRPPKHVSAQDKRQARADEGIRNTVEGKFGQAKRRFSLARVMTKLASTSATQITLTFLTMNLELALRRFFFCVVIVWRWLGQLVALESSGGSQSMSQARSPRAMIEEDRGD